MKERRQLWDLKKLIQLLDTSPSVMLFTEDDHMELYRLANIYEAHCFDMQVYANAVSLYLEQQARENASPPNSPPSAYQNASDEWKKLRKEADKMLLPTNLSLGSKVVGCRPALTQGQYNEMIRKIQRYNAAESIYMLDDEEVGAEELADHFRSIIKIIESLKKELLKSRHLLDSESSTNIYETNRYLDPLTVSSRQDHEEDTNPASSSTHKDSVVIKPVGGGFI